MEDVFEEIYCSTVNWLGSEEIVSLEGYAGLEVLGYGGFEVRRLQSREALDDESEVRLFGGQVERDVAGRASTLCGRFG